MACRSAGNISVMAHSDERPFECVHRMSTAHTSGGHTKTLAATYGIKGSTRKQIHSITRADRELYTLAFKLFSGQFSAATGTSRHDFY